MPVQEEYFPFVLCNTADNRVSESWIMWLVESLDDFTEVESDAQPITSSDRIPMSFHVLSGWLQKARCLREHTSISVV